MAKGSPTAAQATDTSTNFGVGAAPGKASGPNIMAGASMTKAPNDAAAKSGYWAPNSKLPAGVTAQWVPPAAAAVAPPVVNASTGTSRDDLVRLILTGQRPSTGTPYAPNSELGRLDRLNALRGSRGSRGGGASQGDRGNYGTSGRSGYSGSNSYGGWGGIGGSGIGGWSGHQGSVRSTANANVDMSGRNSGGYGASGGNVDHGWY